MSGRARTPSPRVILSLAVLILCGPVLADFVTSSGSGAFGYVAPDAFYYLTVARNVARDGLVSFDGSHLINGFHPAWQAICAALYLVLDAVGMSRHVVSASVGLSLAAIAGGLWLLGSALHRAGRLNPGFLFLPFGVYALTVVPLWSGLCFLRPSYWTMRLGKFPLYGTLWSYANAMESGLVLLAFGALALFHVRATERYDSRDALAVGGTASLLALSRLDHALVALPVVLAYALVTRAASGGRSSLTALAAFGAPIASYMVVNRFVFGRAMPISGALKTTFPVPTLENLSHLQDVWQRDDCTLQLTYAWREAQMLIPLAFAAMYLAWILRITEWRVHLRAEASAIDRFLAPVACGVALLAAYNFFFVPAVGQGHWYYPVSTVFASLAVLAIASSLPRLPQRARYAFGATLVVVSLGGFMVFCRQPTYNARLASFYWEGSKDVQRYYRGNVPPLLESDDGILGFSLDVPTMSASVMLDVEGVEALRKGRLIELAYERGFRHVATLAYHPDVDLHIMPRNPGNAGAWVSLLVPEQDLHGFTASFDYIAPELDFVILRLAPQAP